MSQTCSHKGKMEKVWTGRGFCVPCFIMEFIQFSTSLPQQVLHGFLSFAVPLKHQGKIHHHQNCGQITLLTLFSHPPQKNDLIIQMNKQLLMQLVVTPVCLFVWRSLCASTKVKCHPFLLLFVPCLQHFSIHVQKGFFTLTQKPLHAGTAHHNVNHFVGPLLHGLLCMQDIVSGTNLAHSCSCTLLALSHGQVGEQVMFNLTVEPSMEKVNRVVATHHVGRCQNLVCMKGTQMRATGLMEPKHVVTCMVGGHDAKGMEVGEPFSPCQVDKDTPKHGAAIPRPPLKQLNHEFTNDAVNGWHE